MFRIRRVYDDILPLDRQALVQVQEILRVQFPDLPEREIAKLPQLLRNPLKYRFRSILYVAEEARAKVRGFALVSHAPDLHFCYLDYIAVTRKRLGGGIGSALYELVRQESRALGAVGLFFECLPDEPSLCRDPVVLAQNKARLKFYERYGARPIAGTAYETPFKPEDDCPPFLVFDDLGLGIPLARDRAREIVRAILERKYGHRAPAGYIDRVVDSFRDDPVRLRPPRYVQAPGRAPEDRPVHLTGDAIALVVNEGHQIHHVHDRGYVEAPARLSKILEALERTGLFERQEPHHFGEEWIRRVHASDFVDFLKRVCLKVEPGKSVYPYVFPIRNAARPPKELPIRAGYYCIDTFTPLNRNAYSAAKGAVDCALTAARSLLRGHRLAYALVRPPGHHAEKRAFGGFCYFNSTAVAANYLASHGRVAVVDVDYHHGNGTQNIFYERSDVLTVSIHGHPSFAYPYFSGFRDEAGAGEGLGKNINYPLPEHVDGKAYLKVLEKALAKVHKFRPHFLVVALGLDTAKGDPTGTWTLLRSDFLEMGRLFGAMGRPTLVVQEGGYRIRNLGANASAFFTGLWRGFSERNKQG